jgi:hypothetical protein
LLELGIDQKAIVEEVSPSPLAGRDEQPSMNQRFSSHNSDSATFERKTP